ncbi:Clavaminate synthase-like protein [Didymella exigua CBS 183.55]|uniref:Clavaminate synthase-like protein n=1 Tax=Didymella exigua CBS 183.55 TaxID=1150837 RepID=A0A6A5RIK0_9PLEO|nr:Clavaminate synthase-like protein [Didymella exigua CBS 183.55]KAF1926276.1 Clavaminate synthase-like protein [Didymella exigua CBS 183.55]
MEAEEVNRQGSWDGFETFFPLLLGQVTSGEPIKMLLPGFPFKSPNSRDKVLSNLPDLGEKFALKHLNGLCENTKAVYGHGAEVHITSDGLVYNEHYLANASDIRQELTARYGDSQFEADMAKKSSSDMQLTQTKYLEFLKSDLLLNKTWLAQSPEEQAVTISETAKAMMGRWKVFAAALEVNRTDYVRLSIHDSEGRNKLSMALIPQKQRGALGATPWHSVVVAELDGSYRSVQRRTVGVDKYELIHHNGRPYFFRAKSDLFDWSADNCDVTFEHLYPSGLIIRPAAGAPSMTTIPMKKVCTLTNTFSPIILRGFSNITERDTFINSANELGENLVWPQYGVMSVVKDVGKDDKNANNVISKEAMPMHFDGISKYKDVTNPVTGAVTKMLNPPGYQYFTCIATAPKGSGCILFTASHLFFRYLSPPWSVERPEPVTWGTHNTGFWKQDQEKLKLVVRHPATGEPCLRWHEPWNKTKYSTCGVFIENEDQALIDVINIGIYDWRSCLRFSWEQGDLMCSDNTAMLHTRSTYEYFD